ncbi:DUF6767 domain-containing protein [Micromonospora sp. NPDC004551]|uniref:DUF6767 domain-containing protein n=1 Tax=Micromonospora sp. NPDC004551 TaxID=3154284 RepID=UPI0033B4F100
MWPTLGGLGRSPDVIEKSSLPSRVPGRSRVRRTCPHSTGNRPGRVVLACVERPVPTAPTRLSDSFRLDLPDRSAAAVRRRGPTALPAASSARHRWGVTTATRRSRPEAGCPLRPGEPCTLCQVDVTGPQDCGLVWLVMGDDELREGVHRTRVGRSGAAQRTGGSGRTSPTS